jgi:hypothetical protein
VPTVEQRHSSWGAPSTPRRVVMDDGERSSPTRLSSAAPGAPVVALFERLSGDRAWFAPGEQPASDGRERGKSNDDAGEIGDRDVAQLM